MTGYKVGDQITIEGELWEIQRGNHRIGGRYVLALRSEWRECESIGCTNNALAYSTQIAPATNVRVCAECAGSF